MRWNTSGCKPSFLILHMYIPITEDRGIDYARLTAIIIRAAKINRRGRLTLAIRFCRDCKSILSTSLISQPHPHSHLLSALPSPQNPFAVPADTSAKTFQEKLHSHASSRDLKWLSPFRTPQNPL